MMHLKTLKTLDEKNVLNLDINSWCQILQCFIFGMTPNILPCDPLEGCWPLVCGPLHCNMMKPVKGFYILDCRKLKQPLPTLRPAGSERWPWKSHVWSPAQFPCPWKVWCPWTRHEIITSWRRLRAKCLKSEYEMFPLLFQLNRFSPDQDMNRQTDNGCFPPSVVCKGHC